MNWIEIDKLLISMLQRHTEIEQAYIESEKQFKWNRSQARSAIDPLVKRHKLMQLSNTPTKQIVKAPKKRSKPLTKRK